MVTDTSKFWILTSISILLVFTGCAPTSPGVDYKEGDVDLGDEYAEDLLSYDGTIVSFRAHHKRGSVDWPYVKLLAPGIVLGALLSGVVADFLSSSVLSLIFALGAVLMAIQIWLAKQPQVAPESPARYKVFITASAIGCGSGLVGIGGGSLVVPYLHYLGEKITRCVGTAAACGLPIAVAGTTSYVVMGWDADMPELSLGYIYLPGFLGIIIASSLTAPLGVRLAHKLPADKLKKIFAVFLLLVGLQIAFKQLS